MSGVDTKTIVTEAGLADSEERAKKEEERWKKQFEKKRVEAGVPASTFYEKTAKPTVSSGFTTEQIEQLERQSAEKKKLQQEEEAEEMKRMEQLKKENLERIKAYESELQQRRQDHTVVNPHIQAQGTAKNFLDLKVESMLAEQIPPPAWFSEIKNGKRFPQQLLDQLNLARTQPQVYASRLKDLRKYFTEHQYKCSELRAEVTLKEGTKGIDELIEYFEKAEPRKSLRMSEGLKCSCLDFVEIQGPKGLEGLDGETQEERVKRMFKYAKTSNGKAVQVQSYGPFVAIDVCFQMLLEDGNPQRPRRHDLMNPEWGVVGIHAGRHAKKLFMVVLILAEEVITE